MIRPRLLESGLTIHADPSGRGPSDHASFYGAGVPVLFMFTGVHSVYHQPGDYGYTVNPVGAMKIIDLVHAIAMDRVSAEERLVYAQAPEEERPGRGGRRSRVTLGIMPDWNAEVQGVLVGEVFEDSAAAEAGLQVGDVIVKFNGDDVASMRDLFGMLRDASPGDIVTLNVDRGGEAHEFKVQLKERE
jgi:S1-C subfamily serine protease